MDCDALLANECNYVAESNFLLKASPYTYAFWLEYKLNPNRSDYNIVFDQTITGNLSVDKLKKAFSKLVDNHFLMQCHLVEKGNVLYWCKNKKNQPLEIYTSRICVEDYIKKPFSLDDGSLYRFALIKEGNNTYNLLLVFHHVLIDGNSYEELIRTISSYYNQDDVSCQSVLSYKACCDRLDYKINCLHKMSSAKFWKNRLEGLPEKNDLPKLRSSSSNSNYTAVGEKYFTIKADTWGKWTSNFTERYSPFNILITLWGVLIARYCNQKKAHVSYPVAIKESQGLLSGAQVNLLVLPIRLNKATTYNQFYRETINFIDNLKISSELSHRYLPSREIIKGSGIRKLNVSFSQLDLKDSPLSFDECQCVANQRNNIDLADSELWLQYKQDDQGFNFRLLYRSDLFTDQQANVLIDSFQFYLEKALLSPNEPLTKLPLLDYNRLTHEKASAGNSYQLSKMISIPIIFEMQVKKTPNHLAIKCGNDSITYAELNKKANQFANYLVKHLDGLRATSNSAQKIIAVMMEKSIDFVTVVLGILKTGAAYLPIDMDCPKERLQIMLDDANPMLVVSQEENYQRLVQVKDDISPDLEFLFFSGNDYLQEPTQDFRTPIYSDNLAYVIYTSGSTGKPKGVLINHAGVVNFIFHQINTFGINDDECIAMLHSIAFDASVEQFALALFTGSCLLIIDPKQFSNPDGFVKELEKNSVTHIDMTPSFLNAFNVEKIKSVKRIITGAEPCSAELVKKYEGKLLINEYGPTETTIVSLQHIFSKDDNNNIIGKPIANTKTYVVDDFLNIVPAGVIGELCISGIGLARGYLNEPTLTSKKFIKNPFASNDEVRQGFDRIYRTGDFVRQLENGNVEYVGRVDSQINVRGYRIELSEIENVLSKLPGIIQAVVTLKAKNQITAYYIANSTVEIDMLKNELKQVLPEYMVPKFFVKIDAFPTNINYKVDVDLLPEPSKSQSVKVDYIEPKSILECKLHAIWKKVLKLDRISMLDDFFDLGGDSILSVELISELKANGIACSIKDIYCCRTIKKLTELSSVIDSSKEETTFDSAMLLHSKLASQFSQEFLLEDNLIENLSDFEPYILYNNSPNNERVFLFPPGNGGAESYINNIVNYSNYNMVVFNNLYWHLLHFVKLEDLQCVSYESLARQYIREIKRIQPRPPYHLFGWCFGGVLAFEVMRQLTLAGDRVGTLTLVDAYFDFKNMSEIPDANRLPNKDYCLLNYHYNPPKLNQKLTTTITLFKATQIESRQVVSEQLDFVDGLNGETWFENVNKHYVQMTTDNQLGTVLRPNNYVVELMTETHSSWLNNPNTIKKIINKLLKRKYYRVEPLASLTSMELIEA